ncbi:MAG: hypothetical protein A3E01_10100 [Gammaproteobacteria bacterium RIFCSPHIGHO2_12_FULL_63_22]|nr:MAG: hypothetical protein A3E01_10100 [Gammaproteobacteria bacterium RIFCSPHIGHO2_12_FULL_63_22]
MKADWPDCPHCPGEELINADRPGYYECGYCDRKYPVTDFEQPEKKTIAGAARVLTSAAPRQVKEKKETAMALAKDDPNKNKLWQVNFRRKKKGLPAFPSLEAALKDGSYVPRGAGVKTPRAAREKTPPKARRRCVGGARPARPYPTPALDEIPAVPGGNGPVSTARAIALAELDKMITCLASARAVMASIPDEG